MKLKILRSLEIGDIVIVKSFTPIGWLIGSAFRCPSSLVWVTGSRPSNHNGIIGYLDGDDTGLYVYESLAKGFVATPLRDYLTDIDEGNCEIKIARIRGGISVQAQKRAHHWLKNHLGTRYDYLSYISHIWRIGLRLTPIIKVEHKSRFYCTEAVQMLYNHINYPIFSHIDMIAPIHIEQLVALGILEIVAETTA